MMRKLSLVVMVIGVGLVPSGCMTVAPKCVDWRVYESQAEVEIEKRDAQALDLEAYQGRVRHRNRLVRPPRTDEVELLLIEPEAEVEIIDEQGYKNGLTCLFFNESTVDLDVEVKDPRGQQFKFTLARSMTSDQKKREVARVAKLLEKPDLGWEDKLKALRGFLRDLSANQKELKLELGYHQVSAFRQRRDSGPWVEARMNVRSDKVYQPERDQAILALRQVMAEDLGLTPEAVENPGLAANFGLTPEAVEELQGLLARMNGQPGYFGFSRFYGRSWGI